MKRSLMAVVILALATCAFAQNAEEPATKDDVLLLLRTTRSHDMMQRMMEAMVQSVHQMQKGAGVKETDRQAVDEMLKNMPVDEMTEAMIPVYQKHFTHGDITALIAFYSSPAGQKYLEELPAVTAETMQAAMPIMIKYIAQWKDRMKTENQATPNASSAKAVESSSAPK